MKVFVIGPVRKATDTSRNELEKHVAKLEAEGHVVHLPHRDTNQDATGLEICKENAEAIAAADEVHLFYLPESLGSHFDLGVTFALKKRLRVIKNVPYGEGKSYPRMVDEWEKSLEVYE